MLRPVLFTLCTGLLVASALGADVYKFKDEKGNIQYTDRPLTLPAERINIQSQRTDVVELQERTDAEAKSSADQDKARQKAEQAKTVQKTSAASGAEDKAKACDQARKDYYNIMSGRRHFEEQPNGERRYLTAEEIESFRASNKKAMDALCN